MSSWRAGAAPAPIRRLVTLPNQMLPTAIMTHPLLAYFHAAANASFPPVDGAVTVVPPFDNGWSCSVAFTGHAVIATAKPHNEILARGADVFGGSMSPEVLRYLAGPAGFVGVIDA